MAGIVAVYEPETTPQERETDFQRLLETTAQFKGLDLPVRRAIGNDCTAAKLDAPSSLHCGFARDEQSGSWLMAAGTVVALEGNNDPRVLLERLLRDYLDNSINALDCYDGHFALVIFNGRDSNLSIISDPMGLFAIYYGRRGRQILVSTSALAIARQLCSRPDPLMLECFLRSGRPHGDKTLWQDVKRLRPATALKISRGQIQEVEYWEPVVDEKLAHLTLGEALEQAEEAITRAFEKALRREGKVWADLTGGFDTRVTTMFMAKMGIPFVAYCLGPEDHPDVQISRLVCREMGWEYQHMPLPGDWAQEGPKWFETALHRGEGHLNVLQLAGVLKAQYDRSRIHSVHVTGGGVDEWRYHPYGSKVLIPGLYSRLDMDEIMDTRILSQIPLAALSRDRTDEVRAELGDNFTKLSSKYAEMGVLTQRDCIFIRHRHITNGGAYLSAEAGLQRGVLPFCFKDLESFCFSLNHSWRIKYQFYFIRNLLENGNPQLANIRTVIGGPATPIRVSNLDKFGPLWRHLINHFFNKASRKLFRKPISIWPDHPHSEYPLPDWKIAWLDWAVAENLLTPGKMISGALYNTPALAAIVDQGLAGNHQTGEFLDRVITLEMALRVVGIVVE